jgi:hypothetical protein
MVETKALRISVTGKASVTSDNLGEPQPCNLPTSDGRSRKALKIPASELSSGFVRMSVVVEKLA